MISPDKIIKEYRVTEKANQLTSDHNQYTFEVAREATRTQVALAVEQLFGVKVARVNTLNHAGKTRRSRTNRGKVGRTASRKLAIVTLKEGEAIELV